MGVTLTTSSVVGASSSGARGDVMNELANGIARASSTLPAMDYSLMAEGLRGMQPGASYAVSHADKLHTPSTPQGPGQGRGI